MAKNELDTHFDQAEKASFAAVQDIEVPSDDKNERSSADSMAAISISDYWSQRYSLGLHVTIQ